VNVPPLTWLYVPADRPDRVGNALASAAHAVIVDLEDGVAPAAKTEARDSLSSLLDRSRGKPVFVRINGLRTGLAEDDLDVVRELGGIEGVIVPKVKRPEDVGAVAGRLLRPLEIHCLIESAAGVEAAYAIACAPGVHGISLGEADLRSETGALEAGLAWARGRIVNAAVAAGLSRPPQAVYPNVRDLEGLTRSCILGRELGHLGRAAIHPDQLAPIEQAYLPADEEVARARATIDRLGTALETTTLADGEFVDAAMLGAARQVVAIAKRYGTAR
jgi:citrate lyase subunit beta/citryl-CoA lyase